MLNMVYVLKDLSIVEIDKEKNQYAIKATFNCQSCGLDYSIQMNDKREAEKILDKMSKMRMIPHEVACPNCKTINLN